MTRLLTFLSAATLCIALPAHADEVRLKNGDRISGATIALAGGTLSFKAQNGDLKIPWTDVVSLAIDMPMLVKVGTSAPTSATFAGADPAGLVTLVPGGQVRLADIVALIPPRPGWEIASSAGAGVVQTAGNTQVNNLRLSGDFVAKADANRYTMSAIATHAKDRGVETARNWTATGRYDRFLTPRMFANATANFTNDRFRDIDLRSAIGAGLGYQVIAATRTTLSADAGIAWVKENFLTIPDDSYATFHEAAAFQVQVLPNRVQAFHQHDGYFGRADGKRFLRTQNGFRFGLTAGFVTTIEEDIDYDRRPAPGRRQTDRTFSLTLGYRF